MVVAISCGRRLEPEAVTIALTSAASPYFSPTMLHLRRIPHLIVFTRFGARSTIARHTDWVSCCAIIPSTSVGSSPSALVSGGRDGSVRFWSKSRFAAAPTAPRGGGSEQFVHSKASAPRMDSDFSGEGGRWGGGVGGGSGGWSLDSCMSGAHGSSEFVTCCACPGGASGASEGWVATGATDWSVSEKGTRSFHCQHLDRTQAQRCARRCYRIGVSQTVLAKNYR